MRLVIINWLHQKLDFSAWPYAEESVAYRVYPPLTDQVIFTQSVKQQVSVNQGVIKFCTSTAVYKSWGAPIQMRKSLLIPHVFSQLM